MRKRELLSLHKRLCKELGIPPTEVVAVSPKRAREETGRAGWFNHPTRKIYVAWYGGKRCSPEWTLAHETYHWFQNFTGALCSKRYKGTPKRYWKKRGPWSTWPWERAANRFANKIAEREGWK